MSQALPISRPAAAPAPVRRPRRVAGPFVAGLALALAVVAAGAALLREALVASGVLGGTTWWEELAPRLADLRPGAVTDALAAGALLVGLGLLVLALRPAPSRGRRLVDGAAVVGDRDLARWVQARLADVPGATSVRVRGGRRLAVTVVTLAPPEEHEDVAEVVRADAAGVLSSLESPPRVKVRLRHQDGVS